MPRRSHRFQNSHIYHLFNRGVEKRDIFLDETDRRRFLKTLVFYQQEHVPTKLSLADFNLEERTAPLRFDILMYCLMPNHFHLLVRQLGDEGIREGVRLISNSYAHYFNTRYHREGSLFQGRFKSVRVSTDAQLLQVVRYIVLNPYVARLVEDPALHLWSGYPEYLADESTHICETESLLDLFGGKPRMQEFVSDYAEYARSVHDIGKLAID